MWTKPQHSEALSILVPAVSLRAFAARQAPLLKLLALGQDRGGGSVCNVNPL